MSKLKGKVVKAARVRNADVGTLVGRSLRKLRDLAGLTQADLAERLNVGQASVSKIECGGDVQISSLQKYVEALGATLRIEAAFKSGEIKNLPLNAGFDGELADRNKFVFQILSGDEFSQKRDVVLSVHPRHSEKILKGIKTVELRRRFPVAVPRGITAYIYSTSPVRAMVGSTELKDIIKLPIADIWTRFGKMAQIDRADFKEYFSGLNEGFALKIANARSFARPIDLSELRERFGFKPPQSFLYATSILRTALKDEYPDVSN